MRVAGAVVSTAIVGVIAMAVSSSPTIVTEEMMPDREAGGIGSVAVDVSGDYASCGGPLAEAPSEYAAIFKSAGEKHDVDPQVLAAIAKQESGFTPSARNASSGAAGMMQLMPATARGLMVRDSYDPVQAVDGAARLYKGYLKDFGTQTKALAAYNAGPVAVKKYGGIPPYAETQDYVQRITGFLSTTTACEGGAGAVAPSGAVEKYMGWAESKVGGPYVFGGNGPVGFDCSSFVLTALKQVGVNTVPRTAAAQRDWCAAGNCVKVAVNDARKGDIFFWDSYLGPDTVGHVGFVLDPVAKTTVDARSTKRGIIRGSYDHHGGKNIFEVWRPKL